MGKLIAVLLLGAGLAMAADPGPVAPADLVEWLQLRSEAAEVERDFAQNEAEINKYLQAMRRRHPLDSKQDALLKQFEGLQNQLNLLRDKLTEKYQAKGYTMKPDGTWEKVVAQAPAVESPAKE